MSSQDSLPVHPSPETRQSHGSAKARSTLRTIAHHIRRHAGVGIIISVGYFDPGNWSVDLQAGSTFGYRTMLFVILLAGIMAIILQVSEHILSDLATNCRVLLHKHPKHPKLIRRCVLYPLYVLAEICIISTDLAELLGSAIGTCLIFPKLPIWAGVLITGVDVLIFLIIGDPTRNRGRPVQVFEFAMIILVGIVFVGFIVLIVKVSPNWAQAFYGFIPSNRLLQSSPNAVYIAIGIVGATVMPHTLFLGSYLSTQDRVEIVPLELPDPSLATASRFRRWWKSFTSQFYATRMSEDRRIEIETRHGYRDNNSLSFIRAHMTHGLVDIVVSLLTVAVPVNAAIVILAATVFYDPNTLSDGSLFTMHDLIRDTLGKGFAFIFALALVCSGQTASITATFAGQLVSEGFIQWHISPFLRRLITRLLSLIPSMIVAISSGRSGIDTLLVASQVALSVVLPFVAFPLIYLTASKSVMYARRERTDDQRANGDENACGKDVPQNDDKKAELESAAVEAPPMLTVTEVEVTASPVKVPREDKMDFSNSYMMTIVAFLVWAVVVLANVYVIVMLGLGDTGE
ncbi:Nramp-domain-containing protein [Coniophora puteana RWD-64-598 SS2]|uniref:Nramp-domain-containing protein n=1 Tax=Coniophora puteana (strain RWD-64-598) TaxID=741705 RepID=A0A5M3MMG5_CONPW|nr:Nramp-domain-containing protein [Coniophora puteana RWD-64-598 SS2]EIW80368.1 Nramp-domain-containing protein [Coniophora puteana RWD-64-598 SS2]